MELTLEQKIKYAGLLSRIFMFFGFVFVLFGLVAKVMAGDPNANAIALTGLVFVALCGVFAWMKLKLTEQQSGGRTFHTGG